MLGQSRPHPRPRAAGGIGKAPAPSSSPMPEMYVDSYDLEAKELEDLQSLASQVGVGFFGLDKDQLLAKLIFEGTH